MTNDLDQLLEQVEDALEDGEEQLWQPDLTELVLPSLPVQAAGEGSEQAIRTRQQTNGQDALQEQMSQNFLDQLPAGQRHTQERMEQVQKDLLEEQSQSAVRARQQWARAQAAQGGQASQHPLQAADEAKSDPIFWTEAKAASAISSPALLEQLRRLERTQASLQALSRSQTASGTPLAGAAVSRPGSSVSYNPAALGGSPLAAAAAAAQEEDQARAVDRAFQRDSRRYDRGFSLY